LKNQGSILPLDPTRLRKLAIIGPSAGVARHGGGGSSTVSPFHRISAYQGLREALPASVAMDYEIGTVIESDLPPVPAEFLKLKGEYFTNKTLSGKPALVRADSQLDFDWGDGEVDPLIPATDFSARWIGTITAPRTRDYQLVLGCDDGCRMWIDGKLLINEWRDQGYTPSAVRYAMKAGESHAIRIEYYQGGGLSRIALAWAPATPRIEDAVELARHSDVALVFVGLAANYESEGFDRTTLALAGEQGRLIKEVATANPNTIVVVQAGAPILMGAWRDSVPAILQAWYPGQEGGTAIADILLGRVNPSGKMPITFPKAQSDTPAYGNFPGQNKTVHYAEGIFVGYRHYDTRNIEPEFPFGFGLSYTTFSLSQPQLTVLDSSTEKPKVRVAVTVTNTGAVAGAETVQIYVHQRNPTVARPAKELKAFKKVELKPGETKLVELTLGRSAFAYFDSSKRTWTVDTDQFDILVGTSSRDMNGQATITLGTK
jgi:beta-glucosidase